MSEIISDATRPNAGRIYDYMLGGYHNFEIDRQAAEQVMKLLPFISNAVRLQRWCLQDIAEELTQRRGYDVIIDFASGLPTQDHIHQNVPPGTTVIYSDHDPVTVEYAREILQDVPNTFCFQADACQPEELFERPEVQDILQGRRDIAFVVWGVASFLADEELSYLMHYLHNWAGAKSCLAFQAQGADVRVNTGDYGQVARIYQQAGTTLYPRLLEDYQRLIEPWQPDASGFISLIKWHGLDPMAIREEDRATWGPGGAGYGAYLVK